MLPSGLYEQFRQNLFSTRVTRRDVLVILTLVMQLLADGVGVAKLEMVHTSVHSVLINVCKPLNSLTRFLDSQS